MKTPACFLVIVAVTSAQAETLYKAVGPDGRITYTDRAPADSKSTSALRFADAPSTPLPDPVLKYQAALQKNMQNRLAEAKKIDSISMPALYIATWCGYCTKAKAYLRARGIRCREIDIDKPDGGRAYFDAGGQRGVPLLMADGKRQSGFSEGSYDYFFSAKK